MRVSVHIKTLLLSLLWIVAAAGVGGGRAEAAAGPWWQHEFGAVRLIAATDAVGHDKTVGFGLQFRMAPGWKIYWRSPGDAGYPPKPDWSASDNLAQADIAWPAPVRFSILGLETLGYEEMVVLPVMGRLDRAAEPLRLRASVPFLTCADICVPFEATLALDLAAGPARPAPEAALIARFAAQVPRRDGAGVVFGQAAVAPGGAGDTLYFEAEADQPFVAPDVFVEGPKGVRFGAPRFSFSPDRTRASIRVMADLPAGAPTLAGTPLTVTLTDSARAVEARLVPSAVAGDAIGDGTAAGQGNILAILALALLGGLILNLMPCVLPVLSLKLLAVIGHGGASPAQVRRGFLASAAGIVCSFLVLGTAAVLLKQTGELAGWGIHFQNPWFLGAMAALLALFALNLWGAFHIRLPGLLADPLAAAGRDGEVRGALGGHFLTGAFATLLATPCSAPFLGTAIGFALARGPAEIYAVFAVLGLGLAVPYLAVAARPRLVIWLPRPGRWMTGLRRLLGAALMVTAVWLVVVLAQSTGAAPRLMALIGAEKDVAGDAGARQRPLWHPFDRLAIAREVALGRVVFVDVTADWCLTCKVNEAIVLQERDIARRLSAPAVTAMRADWTRPDPRIADYLARYGRYGIPFNAVYGPALPDGRVLPEILTPAMVRAALEDAAGPAAPASAASPASRS